MPPDDPAGAQAADEAATATTLPRAGVSLDSADDDTSTAAPDTITNADILSTGTHRDEHGEFTVYEVTCSSRLGASWTVAKRYSDFTELLKELNELPSGACGLSLPRKRLLSSRHSNKVIEERKTKLQAFLVKALGIFGDTQAVLQFLRPNSVSRRQIRSAVLAMEVSCPLDRTAAALSMLVRLRDTRVWVGVLQHMVELMTHLVLTHGEGSKEYRMVRPTVTVPQPPGAGGGGWRERAAAAAG